MTIHSRALAAALTLLAAACAEEPQSQAENKGPMPAGEAEMLVAGGCFWCVEADLEKVAGVTEVISGYAGGTNENPTYENYDEAGHREVALVRYDPSVIGFERLAEVFIRTIDVTDGGGQFCDRGYEYSPAVYYSDAEERTILETVIAEGEEEVGTTFDVPIEEAPRFWPAEDYHQDYYKKNQIRYGLYRQACGRDRTVKNVWGQNAGELLASL
ncbi:MAG: peptide-methionine (S)-S-oxide reductase MsrA [Parvularcula sp.]|nr:peptide-methionine (S)-S-oxide reductase MsrA [Parvularcula sp.]